MTTPSPQQRIDMLGEMFGVAPHFRPWALPSLPAYIAEDLTDYLGRFVTFLNGTYAVEEKHVLYPCWALHPGLVHELAILFALWVDAHQGPGALSPDKAGVWHDRWLPHFYDRARRYFGDATAQCRVDHHDDNWNPTTRVDAFRPAAKPPTADEVKAAITSYRDNPATIPAPGT